jgi:hypothetical protein
MPTRCGVGTGRHARPRPQTPPTCLRCLLAQTNDRRARAARKQLLAGLPCASGDELVSLGFRVGNPSAIGWHQRASFQASLLPVGVGGIGRHRHEAQADRLRSACRQEIVLAHPTVGHTLVGRSGRNASIRNSRGDSGVMHYAVLRDAAFGWHRGRKMPCPAGIRARCRLLSKRRHRRRLEDHEHQANPGSASRLCRSDR